jgi:hypothetical protein
MRGLCPSAGDKRMVTFPDMACLQHKKKEKGKLCCQNPIYMAKKKKKMKMKK